MGAVQKLATVVVVGLVGLATLLVVYFANEPHRRSAEEEEQREVAIDRGEQTYIQNCLLCHGPKGEGFAAGDGRAGWPLNPDTESTIAEDPENPGYRENQSTDPTIRAERERVLRTTIHNGRPGTSMPAWGRGNPAGPTLNDEQIYELVLMIQNVNWDDVYEEVLAENNGAVPTVPVPPTTAPEEGDAGPQLPTFTIASKDIAFEPTEITVPADVQIRLDLPNRGAIGHNFSIDALGIDVDEPAGSNESIDISIQAGSYEYYCNVPGHKEGGMVGTLVADPAAAVPTPAVGAQPAASPAAGGEQAAPTAVTITAEDIAFEPKEVAIPANAPVLVSLPNAGAIAHNFSIDQLKIDVDLPVGSAEEVTITAAPGTYEYYCNVPGHKEAGMVGTLTVAEGAAPPGSEPAAAEPPAAGGEQPAAAPAAVSITSKDIAFEPKDVTIPANVPVAVSLPNAGAIAHNFSIDALGVSVDQPVGSTGDVTINAAPGEYQYYCNVPGHKEAGMIGTLIVQEGASAAPPAAEPAASPPPPAAEPTAAAAAATPAGTPGPSGVTITAHDIFFEPKEAAIPANTAVEISLPNDGAIPHNFSIDELGISVDLPNGATEVATINAAAGEYQYYCNVPGHKAAGMVGTLHVQ